MNNLTELLEEQVKDLYNAENQLAKALARMAKAAATDELREAFELHLEETNGQIERLEQVCEMLDFKPTGKVCAAMKGLIEEGKEVLEEDGHEVVLDAALVAAAQRIEHYEIAAYGTVKAIAQQLGHDEAVALFDETLQEEIATDEKLTELAENTLYALTPKTEDDGGEEGEEEDGEESSGRSKSSGGRKPPSRAAASKGGKKSKGGGRKVARSR